MPKITELKITKRNTILSKLGLMLRHMFDGDPEKAAAVLYRISSSLDEDREILEIVDHLYAQFESNPVMHMLNKRIEAGLPCTVDDDVPYKDLIDTAIHATVYDSQQTFEEIVKAVIDWVTRGKPKAIINWINNRRATLAKLGLAPTSDYPILTRYLAFTTPGVHKLDTRVFSSWTAMDPGDTMYNHLGVMLAEALADDVQFPVYLYRLVEHHVSKRHVVLDVFDFVDRSKRQSKLYDNKFAAKVDNLLSPIPKGMLDEHEVIVLGSLGYTQVTNEDFLRVVG